MEKFINEDGAKIRRFWVVIPRELFDRLVKKSTTDFHNTVLRGKMNPKYYKVVYAGFPYRYNDVVEIPYIVEKLQNLKSKLK